MKRPPRQVWCVVTDGGYVMYSSSTRKGAKKYYDRSVFDPSKHRVVGPYVLAERVRER